MLGLPKGDVFLLDSTDEWVTEYKRESDAILKLIGKHVSSIHHIGSTAVPGLKAKPIIDMAIELYTFDLGFECIEFLSGINYKHRIIPELPDRHYWSKGEPRTHQIHMYEEGCIHLDKQIKFRDKLRADKVFRAEYEALKVGLSCKYSDDKLAYAKAKTKFIKSVF